jgi:ArsR family transcriptional regulator
LDDQQLSLYADLLRVVAHPTRLMILAELTGGTKCVSDIRDLLDVPQPNVSQHLAVLKEKGLVDALKDGTSRCYYLARPRLVKGLFAALSRDRGKRALPAKGGAGRSRAGRRRCRERGKSADRRAR